MEIHDSNYLLIKYEKLSIVVITGAGGETRTPNIQTRSLNGWNSKDKQG